MPSERETPNEDPSQENEKQLCLNCMFPNEPAANFCVKCRAPLTSYAATGPLESVYAEGQIYRQAAERPRSLVVVCGIWMIFGAVGLTGLVLVVVGSNGSLGLVVVGALMFALALVMIAKTTRNYFARAKNDATASSPLSPPK